MMSNLRDLIPGSSLWPRFVRNHSDRFEARFSLVEVTREPVPVVAGYGRFADANRRFPR